MTEQEKIKAYPTIEYTLTKLGTKESKRVIIKYLTTHCSKLEYQEKSIFLIFLKKHMN